MSIPFKYFGVYMILFGVSLGVPLGMYLDRLYLKTKENCSCSALK